MSGEANVRLAHREDDKSIREISNQGIADRVATLDTSPRFADTFKTWRDEHDKILLFGLSSNDAGHGLYRNMGYRNVGTFRKQGLVDGHFVDVLAMEKIMKPSVLFVCKHNTGRSQMAEAFLRHFGGDQVEVGSAGTIAADRPDPGVVAAMAEIGLDISAARPKLLDAGVVAKADRIITMGCDVEGVPRIDADWGLPDPKGQSRERIREIRDLVRAKARALANEITAS